MIRNNKIVCCKKVWHLVEQNFKSAPCDWKTIAGKSLPREKESILWNEFSLKK